MSKLVDDIKSGVKGIKGAGDALRGNVLDATDQAFERDPTHPETVYKQEKNRGIAEKGKQDIRGADEMMARREWEKKGAVPPASTATGHAPVHAEGVGHLSGYTEGTSHAPTFAEGASHATGHVEHQAPINQAPGAALEGAPAGTGAPLTRETARNEGPSVPGRMV